MSDDFLEQVPLGSLRRLSPGAVFAYADGKGTFLKEGDVFVFVEVFTAYTNGRKQTMTKILAHGGIEICHYSDLLWSSEPADG